MDTQIVIGIAGIIISGLISLIVSLVIASLKIGGYKNKVDTTVSDISDLKKEVKEIRDKVIACETSLKEREPLTRRKSPITLSERGIKILNESGGKKFIDDNFPELKEKVENRNPETSYDIQEYSQKVVGDLKEDTRLNSMKEYLFKEGLQIDDLILVLGIYLRDKILEERHMEIGDIDKYDPAIKKDVE